MKKILSISLITMLITSMLVVPAFAAKPENPGNSNKSEKSNNSSEKAEKKEKEEKADQEDKKEEMEIEETEDGTIQVTIEEDEDADDETEEEERKSSDKVSKFLKKWQNRYDSYQDEDKVVVDDEDMDEDADDETEEINNKGPKAKDDLPHGLAKKEDLPPGLAKKDVLPYGLLKRIDPEAIPKGQVQDEITGEDIDIETLLSDSATLLEEAVEGEDMGEYFAGSIEDYDTALTAYTDLVNSGEATEEELQEAAEELNDAYNTFIMSRRATQDELDDYNNFLEEVDTVIENLEIGEEEGQISPDDYDALVAYFDTLDPYDDGTLISIEAMITLFDQATEKFDEFTGYEEVEETEEESTDEEAEDDSDDSDNADEK